MAICLKVPDDTVTCSLILVTCIHGEYRRAKDNDLPMIACVRPPLPSRMSNGLLAMVMKTATILPLRVMSDPVGPSAIISTE